MKKTSLTILLLLALTMLTLPALAQDDMMGLPEWMNHTECEVDLTGQTFTIWHIGDLSGPYAPITQPLVAALDDAVAYYNAHGGICGAEITLPDPTTVDTGGDQEQTSVIYDRVSSENPVMLTLYSSDDSELLAGRLLEDKIPVVISAGSVQGLYGEDAKSPGWIYATNPLYIDQIGTFCDYVGANMEGQVIGYLSWPNAFGRAAFTPEVVAYCESVGVGFVETPEFFAPGADIQGQIQNLMDGGATILYTNSLATGPAEIAAAVTNMGISDQVQLAGVNWTLDTSVGFLGQTTLNPTTKLPSVDGLIGSMPFHWWTEVDQPGIQLIKEQADASERGALTRNIAYILGWQNVDLFVETVTLTANANNGEVNGELINAVMAELDFNPLGLVHLNFQDGNRDASLNRIAVLKYLGQDGASPAGPDNPPMVVEGPNGPVLVPIVVPLTDFVETPDLRPMGSE